MRFLEPLHLALCALVVVYTPAIAQNGNDLPATTACPADLADLATCYTAKHESGASLLAAMPKNWNGNLVVFAHGGPYLVPPTAITSQGDLSKYSFAVKLGYGWVASSYRREGYGVRMAAEDTEDARAFFAERIAKPRRTILHGASWGGLVGSKLIDLYAKNTDGGLNFDGAFFNSGFVAGAPVGYEFRADLRAVYQYYCKNLPRPDEAQYPLWQGLPADLKMTLKDLEARVDECTGVSKVASARTEQQKENLANIVGVMRFSDRLLVRHMQAATFLLREIAERTTSNGSAFSNMGVRYRGSSNDEELNKGVARFAADSAALAALKADGEASGVLPIPVLSIHSINDPQVAVEVQSAYREMVGSAGSGNRLVQSYTDEPAHTGQSGPELAAGLELLMQWIEKGNRPTPQSVAAACGQMQKTFDGLCRYHPEFQPKPYISTYARGVVAAAAR